MHRRDREYVKDRDRAGARTSSPALRSRLNDPAAQLSGGQQQMLALAMAFLAKPNVLMIDELSLGLAPLVVEQLLARGASSSRSRASPSILVEQSVNVALTAADKAFFMEKGAIRFHGLTAELLERPDLLRSIFLEGAAASAGGRSRRGGQGSAVGRGRRRERADRAARRTAASAASCSRPGTSPSGSPASPRSTTCRSSCTKARSSASSARTAPARPRCSTSSRVPRARLGSDPDRRPRRHPAPAAAAAPSSGSRVRSRTRGCSARSPCTRRCASRSTGQLSVLDPIPRVALPPERRTAPSSKLGEARRRAHRDDGSRRLPRQVRVGPLHRKPPHRRPRVPDRHRAEGDPVRRAVVGHRAA